MTCGLSDDELFILNVLYSHKCLSFKRGKHSEQLKHIYIKKFSSDFEKAIRDLLNKEYITPIRKKELKYYISNIPLMSSALRAHGYSVTKGKVRPL
jgi:hypothetical protein